LLALRCHRGGRRVLILPLRPPRRNRTSLSPQRPPSSSNPSSLISYLSSTSDASDVSPSASSLSHPFSLSPSLLNLVLVFFPRVVVRTDDLESIPPHMLATPAGDKLISSLSRGDQRSTFYLLKASLSAFGSKLGGPVLPKLFLTLFTFGASLLT